MLLNSINSLSAEKAYEIGLKKSNINFRSSSTNSLERTPEEDTVEKKETSKGKKIAIGSLVALGSLVLIDVCFNKSRCLKKIFGRAETKTDEIIGDSPIVSSEGKKTYDSYKQKLDGKMSIKVKDQKSDALEELANYYRSQEVPARNKALRDGNIIEYTINHDGNVFRVKNRKIVEYRNANGEDLLHTFNEQTGPNAEYRSKIQKIIFDVDKKEKTALTHLDNVVIEGQEEALSAKDIARYIKNREMPASREVFSNAVVSWHEPNNTTRIKTTKYLDGRKETTVIRDGLKVNKSIESLSCEPHPQAVVEYKGNYSGTRHYKEVIKRHDGTVEIMEACDKTGKPLKPEKVIRNGRTRSEINFECQDDNILFLRTIRDSKDKGKIIKQEIVTSNTPFAERGFNVIKTLIG